jgi:ABC-2 type transport system ATP-binding protein
MSMTVGVTPGHFGVDPLVCAQRVSHKFHRKVALQDVDLLVHPGEIHALLGPNGAGKTTLLRVLAGLLQPDQGSLTISGLNGLEESQAVRERIGFMPSGDRTLYLRISGLENLVFFGRLQGFTHKDARLLARELLELVGLSEDAHKRVRAYSHGMQKRLSFARSLLTQPEILLIDEATHDLDPKAARVVRALTRDAAARGAAVVWATQRLDEIRGFADRVTLLKHGGIRFSGSVAELVAQTPSTRYLLRLRNGGAPAVELGATLQAALGSSGTIAGAPRATPEDFVLCLEDGVAIGDVLGAFSEAGVRIVACREERSDIEEAFVALTERGQS